jgi:hypothetical protein
MKKLLVTAVLALAVTAASQGKASAWSEFHMSLGFNISYRGGGNCFLWGLYQTSPYPGCPGGYCAWPGCGHGYGYPMFHAYYGAQGYDPYGHAAGWEGPRPGAGAGGGTGGGAGGSGGKGGNEEQSYYPYNAGYQPVGHYYYPTYYQQVPSYWYGR